jgi:hypothetical protein
MSLIVTLTSTSRRLPVLRHTLLSLFDQQCSADRIVLCISKEPYLIDEGIKKLPGWLTSMVEQGQVEINGSSSFQVDLRSCWIGAASR